MSFEWYDKHIHCMHLHIKTHISSRNCLPFTSIWGHLRFLLGSALLIFLVFCVVLCFCRLYFFVLCLVCHMFPVSLDCRVHWCYEFESHSGRGVQHYVIKFVSDLRQVNGVFSESSGSSTNKTDRHDVPEILLKEALNTIKQTTKQTLRFSLTFLYITWWLRLFW